ncbi:hypothetical protein BGZ98_002163 [Dissophora globulifera]|uniref:BAR domain-containing protein n=1 Tax=Dissophora globulifera TaxID=979702 RepID=A0A9P6RRI9_9FUNG|nr:hypothetical protein BGZ98_002163 [Dissophora globulifera]KAG0324839.1 hypothetical protein BGZ99_001403 [Dissophora globulifera]
MSWSGFKKNLNRATTSVLSKTGAVDRTSDREFEEEEKRFKSLEHKVERLHKEANGYAQAVRNMTGSQLRIASTIDQFYDEGAPMGIYGIKYKEAVAKLEQQAQDEVDAAYRTTVLEPVGRYAAYFPEINEAIKRRNKKLLDYDAARTKVRKLVERPSEDATKLPRAEHEANTLREMYETMNAQLTTELPKIIDSRVAYLDPSFEGVVKSQLSFSQDAHNTLESLRQFFPPESEGQQLDEAAEGILQQMRELSICGLA